MVSPRRPQRLWRLWLLPVLLALAAWQTTHAVEIRLRAPDGSPLAGVPVALVRSYSDVVIGDCVTDAAGACRWQAPRGLYVVRTGHDLDAISAAALAESGLPGLALTVGDEAIRYSFVVAAQALYFDQAPQAGVPQPYVPTQADLDTHHAIPTSLPLSVDGPEDTGPEGTGPEEGPAAQTATAEADRPPAVADAVADTVADAVADAPSRRLQAAVAIGLVCLLAAGAWLLVRLVRHREQEERR